MRIRSFVKSGFTLVALTTLAMACGSDKATAPEYQPQVANSPNMAFSFQATGLQNVDDIAYLTWSVASGNIVIHPSTSTTGGSITLRIRDAQGTTIYNGDVPASGDITPPAGAGGDWKIRLTLQNYTGTINFALQMQ